jgi:hypothetical protein
MSALECRHCGKETDYAGAMIADLRTHCDEHHLGEHDWTET